MKMNLFILILAFITSCGNTNNTANTDSPAATPNPVEAIPAPENEDATQNMIVGKFTKEDLQQAPFVTWFNQGYEDYTVIIIADHGNCEMMINPDGSPNTAHTTNPVPIILVDNEIKSIKNGNLGDIAPTILHLMGIQKPELMTQDSLI